VSRPQAVSRAQVIDDQEHERVHDRVAAVDVAKDTGMVCTRMPHPSRPGARQAVVWTVQARMGAVRALGRQLKADGIEIVTLESTSDYWRIWLRREAPCCIPGLAGRNLEDIPGSDGLLKIRKVKGTIACQETSGRADAYGRGAGKTRVIWLKLHCRTLISRRGKRHLRRKDA
jgi:hypothetical protein